ncbi:MAG: polysaccharide biosynthesis protein [Clostridiales bacterium]|nr:polysaccharide biosynthesis protein [Clostridiales bacterium]
MKKESFLKGTVILIAANAVSKILGAVLKIPLTYILGEEGMAIYQTAFSVYIMLLSFVISGLPFAISKYISEALTLDRPGNIRFAVRFSMLLMSVFGLLLSAAMFFGADFFALAMKDPKAGPAVRAISPAIFFVAVGAVYKSCYQGYSHMIPTAVSQVLESFFKLIVGYSLAAWFASFSISHSSAAAIFGVTAGEAFATLILFLLYIPYRRDTAGKRRESRRRAIISGILSVAVPMTVTSIISGSLSLLETSVIRTSLTEIRFSTSAADAFLRQYSRYTHLFDGLQSAKKLSFDGARWLFGAYTGYAGTVFNLPIGILASFGVSVLPVVTRCLTLKDYNRLNSCITSALKIILAVSAPCAVFLAVFSEQILFLLFKNTASASLLSLMAPCLILITTTQFIVSVQYSAGNILSPFYFGMVGLFVKILLSYVLIRIPELNITGVIIASFVSESAQLLLNSASLRRRQGIGFAPLSSVLGIAAASVIMCITARALYRPMCEMLNNGIFGFIAAAVLSLPVYIAAVFGLGALKKEEIIQLAH